MNTITGKYVQEVPGQVEGLDWVSVHTSRVELTVKCRKGVEFFTIERDEGQGFQSPELREAFYPGAVRFYDYTARPGCEVFYRATFFDANDEPIGMPATIAVPTHWVYEEWWR